MAGLSEDMIGMPESKDEDKDKAAEQVAEAEGDSEEQDASVAEKPTDESAADSEKIQR